MQLFEKFTAFSRALRAHDDSRASLLRTIDNELKTLGSRDWTVSDLKGYDAKAQVAGVEVHIRIENTKSDSNSLAIVRGLKVDGHHILLGPVAVRFQKRFADAVEQEEREKERSTKELQKELDRAAIDFKLSLDKFPSVIDASYRYESRAGYDFGVEMRDYSVEFARRDATATDEESIYRYEICFKLRGVSNPLLILSGEEQSAAAELYHRADVRTLRKNTGSAPSVPELF